MRYEDQDRDAERFGYSRMRAQVLERASKEELRLRNTVSALADQTDSVVLRFDTGIATDAELEQYRLKTEQIYRTMTSVLEMRAAAKAPTRELVPA